MKRKSDWSKVFLFVLVILCIIIKYCFGVKLVSLGIRKETKNNLAKEESQFEKPYEKMLHNFEYEYDRCNPITAEKSTKEYLKWMRGNSFLF